MKKEAALTIIFFVLVTSTAFAAPGKQNEHANDNAGKKEKQNVVQVLAEEVTPTPTDTQTTTPTPTITNTQPTITLSPTPSTACDEDAEWKNHGAYVSCVAKRRLGGQTTSQAARSDVGKKKHTITPSPTTISTTPTVTVSPTVTVTPPLTAPEAEASFTLWPDFSGLKKQFAKLFDFFF